MSVEKAFHARQRVPETGLYRVFHYQHRMPHDVMMKQGELFPACNRCGDRVLFRLSNSAEPLLADHDFTPKAA
jgi:hypothetical protein